MRENGTCIEKTIFLSTCKVDLYKKNDMKLLLMSYYSYKKKSYAKRSKGIKHVIYDHKRFCNPLTKKSLRYIYILYCHFMGTTRCFTYHYCFYHSFCRIDTIRCAVKQTLNFITDLCILTFKFKT